MISPVLRMISRVQRWPTQCTLNRLTLSSVSSPNIGKVDAHMNRLSSRSLALLFGLSTLAMTGTAQADHWRFGGGGRVRVHAGVGVSVGGGTSVTYSRPAYYPRSSWSVGGSIYVGSYPRYRYY